MKKYLTFGLVAFAVAGGLYATFRGSSEKSPSSSASAPSVEEALTLPADGIVVTYFTTNVRCPSCHKIENLTRETIESKFAEALANGTLIFRVINVDRPENKHFIDEYQLVSKTVIVSERHAGKETGWKNLQEVWTKLIDPEDFANYIAAGVRSSGVREAM